MTRILVSLTVTAVATLLACTGDPADDAHTDAEHGATAAGGTTDAAQVSAWFADTRALQDPAAGTPQAPAARAAAVPVAEARALATAAAAAAITAAVAAPACVAITTDQATYVEAVFTDCTSTGGRAGLDGTVRGELAFTTVPCGPAMCPTAVRWSLTAALAWRDGGGVDGAWTVTAPIAPGAARTLDGALTSTGPYGATVVADTTATWSSDAAGCVTVDGTATLTAADAASLTVTGLHACPATCPSAGTAAYTSARSTLTWTYGAGATITVTARDRTFALPLHCTP